LGGIDGKIGPLTRKAIEDFQKANNLKVDGKVGPKTWAVLEKSLNAPEAKPIKKGKKR
jgi:peptidoglycan hydrolase-like protein with peptidoglycan-binding domain